MKLKNSQRIERVTSPTLIRRYALEYAKEKRSHHFDRVAQSFLFAVEADARAFIRDRIDRHPSRGVTLT